MTSTQETHLAYYGDFEFRAVDWDDPNAVALRERQRKEIETNFGPENGVQPTKADISFFMLAIHQPSATTAGCGGLRYLEDKTVEVKRMYVMPEFRGKSGLAIGILAQLETEALKRGWWEARIETGVMMALARRFYERQGYSEIPLYHHYIGSEISVAYSKDLRGAISDPFSKS